MSGNGIDIEVLKAAVPLRGLVERYGVALKKSGRNWKGPCPFHPEKTPSFTVYEEGAQNNHFHCFGCKAHGDAITFLCSAEGLSFPEARNRLMQEAGITSSGGDKKPPPPRPPEPRPQPEGSEPEEVWEPIVPTPTDAPEPAAGLISGRYEPFEYTDPNGRRHHYRRRVQKTPDKKDFYPLTFGILTKKGGKPVTGWHTKAPPKPYPLYRLDRLANADPDSDVMVVEGEGKCQAAERLFPDIVCTAWAEGADAVNRSDWSVLRRFTRPPIWWPDADRPREKPHGCFVATPAFLKMFPNARQIDIAGLADIKDGYDAKDLEQGDCDDPRAWMAARLKEAPKPEHECTLAELQSEVIEPIRWVVPDYIPEGLTVFAGRPKIGKSWLILGVGLGVARGTEALGKLVEKGDVLYCGLEDGKRRMQSRVAKVLGPAIKTWPANFTFRYRLDPLDAGGQDSIEQWLIEHPATRLVVVDTLGKVRGMKNAREEQYQYDYRLVGALQELATKYRVAIVVVHHVRKGDAEDVLDTISGTTGIAGAADNLMVLGRHEKGVRLYIRGRDTEEQDKLAEFDPDTGLWEVTGDFDDEAPGAGLQGLRRSIFDLLTGSPIPLTPADIATRLQAPRANVKRTLSRMARSDPPQARPSAGKVGAYEPVSSP